MGGMTLKDAQDNNLNRVMIALQNAKTPEEKDFAEKQLNKIKEQNEKNLEIQRRLNVGPLDIAAVDRYIKVRENFVDNAILKDPEVGKYLIKNLDDSLSINTLISGSEEATATIAAKRDELAQQFMTSLAKTNSGVPEFDFLYNGGTIDEVTEKVIDEVTEKVEDSDTSKTNIMTFPDTAKGAEDMIAEGNRRGVPLTKDYLDKIKGKKSKEFVEAVEKELIRQQTEKSLGATQEAYEEAASPDAESININRLDSVVDRINDLPIIERTLIGNRIIANYIEEELNIPSSEANKLVPQVKNMLKQKSNNLNTGGLMGRRYK